MSDVMMVSTPPDGECDISTYSNILVSDMNDVMVQEDYVRRSLLIQKNQKISLEELIRSFQLVPISMNLRMVQCKRQANSSGKDKENA
jgi:hypothetical protein